MSSAIECSVDFVSACSLVYRMERYRITTTIDGPEQTWVLLPDRPSAIMQAEEFARREKRTRVRVYHERSGQERELVLDLNSGF